MIDWFKEHWRWFAWAGVVILALVIVVQFAYPRDRLVPFAKVDGVAIGHWEKQDAVWLLDRKYSEIKQDFYFGDSKKPYTTVKLSAIGLSVQNSKRIESLSYPWYWRLVPSSLLWMHKIGIDTGPEYNRDSAKQQKFINDVVGSNCQVEPINANLKPKDTKLEVIASVPGGKCEKNNVKKQIVEVEPRLASSNSTRIPVTKIPANITDKNAAGVAKQIASRVGEGVVLEAGDKKVTVPVKDLYSWLKFSSDKDKITATIDATVAKDFLDKNVAPLVLQQAGTTTISTSDFVETSRVEGVRGQTLDNAKTAESLAEFINNGKAPIVQVAPTSPKVVYNRTYSSSNAGLTALMTNFANSHPGTYGVAMYELSGERRRADYNGDKSFVTASTYKLFVAYSTIKRVDAGTWSWSDANIAGGRNRGQCFDDMIIKSDNPCSEALLKAIGYSTITNEMHALGLKNTSFVSDNTPHSTANDEAIFLAQLETKQLPIKDDSRDKMLSAMRQQIFRKGIPAGVNVPVASKVGFLWGLLHDAAIVYSPKGTYVLVILTDNSSWGNIADLAKQIEELR